MPPVPAPRWTPAAGPGSGTADRVRRDVITTLRAAGCVFAEDEADLLLGTAATPAELAHLVSRRASGLPLEHVLGWAMFCGLRIAVQPGVFVPRARTELLVTQGAAATRRAAAERRRRPVVLDLCCGSGAVAAAVRAAAPEIELHAADVDPAAVRCARRNLAPAPVYQGNLYAALPPTLRGRVDVLLANAPYVPTDEIALLPPEARMHEPRAALDGGPDGIEVQRRIAASAPEWLAPGGLLVLETSRRQAPATLDALAGRGLRAHVVRSEELDATVVVGALEASNSGT